jgi:hypothetical protein
VRDYIDTICNGTREDVVALAGELRDEGDRLRVELAVACAMAAAWEKNYHEEQEYRRADWLRREHA